VKRRWIGPHPGTYSEGCPLFDLSDTGRRKYKGFKKLIQYYEKFGGTTITVIDEY
jgi:hypothetical protein